MTESDQFKAVTPNTAADEQIGRLLNEYLERRERGERVSKDVLQAEHPDLAEELAQHLILLQALAPSSDAIQELLAKRVLSPPSSPEFVAELGHYGIKEVIGRGGMGIVFRAIEAPLNRPVALKILRPELAVDHRALVRFEHEAKAAAALRHPNIVTVYACGAQNGTHYLAMEAIDGFSLAERIAQEPMLSTVEIRRMFRELLLGLSAAHQAGLVHRDIKSSNILLDGPDRLVKIADFGLARIAASSTRITLPQAAIGTPEYMSPEQARGEENIDHRTDIYSAGVVLFEMLTGRVPFKRDSISALVHAILSADPPAPRAIQPGADNHLSRMALRLLAKERADRFPSANAVIAALQGQGTIRIPWSGRSRWRALRLGAISLLMLGVLAFWSANQFGWVSPTISDVAILMNDDTPTATIKVTYRGEVDWKPFHTFTHPGAYITSVTKVELWPRDSAVLATVYPPLDGKTLFAFNSNGAELWSRDLSDSYQWPDCESAGEFEAGGLDAFDFDGKPGQEVVFWAGDKKLYATYVAILDPRTPKFIARYWHLGDISTLKVAPDLLGPDRAGIVVTGMNNKLDGFDDPRPRDATPVVKYDYVPIMMVLDASMMSGVRLIRVPDSNGRITKFAPVMPHSYAYLNAAADEKKPTLDQETRAPIPQGSDDLVLAFDAPTIVKCSLEDPLITQCIDVWIARVKNSERSGGASFKLDAELETVGFTHNTDEIVGLTVDYWDQYFRRYVQHGEYVVPSQ